MKFFSVFNIRNSSWLIWGCFLILGCDLEKEENQENTPKSSFELCLDYLSQRGKIGLEWRNESLVQNLDQHEKQWLETWRKKQ